MKQNIQNRSKALHIKKKVEKARHDILDKKVVHIVLNC